MVLIASSLFDVPKEGLEDALKKAANTDLWHIDVTDGVFVKDARGGASLFFDDTLVGFVEERTNIPFRRPDIHLMVDDPLKHIKRYARYGPKYISFHLEATPDPQAVINKIREKGVRPALALNPATPLSEALPFLDHVDMILLMSVVPGKGGQVYISEVTNKIRELREIIDESGLNVKIEVDGGINLNNGYLPITAGADILVSGSGVFKHPEHSPAEVIRRMRDVLVLGSDHAGYKLKEELKKHLEVRRTPYRDLGCFSEEDVDYPVYAQKVAGAIQSGEYQRGVLICGSGIGIGIAANRFRGIRAALCRSVEDAESSRQHNEANILVLGGRVPSAEDPLSIFEKWYTTSFVSYDSGHKDPERHTRRVRMLDNLDN